MLDTLTGIFKNKEIRKRILFTLGILLIFRFGAAIPVPGVDTSKLLSTGDSVSLFGIMNLLGGGAMESFSIFALGVGPYITASIVLQLLSMDIIPPLAELAKQGQTGKRKIDRYTRYLALVLCFIQAYMMTKSFENSYGILTKSGFSDYMFIAILLTAGSMFLLWLADRISIKGIGNGVSIIIFAGIVANLPSNFLLAYNTFVDVANGSAMFNGLLKFSGYILMYVCIIVLVVYMSTAVRKIPIQYTSSAITSKNDMNFLPLRINSANVMPVIFANAIMVVPKTIIAMFGFDNGFTKGLNWFCDLTSWQGLVIYLLLIISFTFFYTKLQMDPEKIAENLNKSGTYIPGIRPGKETRDYIDTVLSRITVFGAMFLAFVAMLPHLMPMITNLPGSLALGGTGIIIVVGVAMETTKQLKGQLTQKSYRGFLQR